ncbi:potassium channel family protein [Actibacterium sp. XHP0104]|uniref:potassium channel family protein n=1 Tax=Actibacterium sp. XHP0104 TaxID=2984335 RepID=UPI0021E770B3|nr:potassium channel family protein [Actibacterium sp. XHP0104]MCV2880633.1 potassium channel family protein [Actibacterium sp. XHP0104]
MIHEIAISTVLILMTVLLAGLAFWAAESLVTLVSPWLVRRPHPPKIALVLVGIVLVVLAVLSASVWIWAAAFKMLELFPTWEAAVYFSIVVFTTLGFGDVLLPEGWRILGGLAAANGLLNMGLYTAMMVEILRRVRQEQIAGRSDDG